MCTHNICFEQKKKKKKYQKFSTKVFQYMGVFVMLQDRAVQLAIRVMTSFKTNDIEPAIKSLDSKTLDTLMKYIYRGFEFPSDGSSASLLNWHEKVRIHINEPPRGKTNNVVSKQVRHKPACTSTEKS